MSPSIPLPVEIPVTPAERRERLRGRLSEEERGALLVTSLPNIRYLSGFTGSAGVLVVGSDGADLFVTDGRYDRQAREEVAGGVEVEIVGEPAMEVTRERLEERGRGSVACEAEHLSVAAWRAWEEQGGPPLVPVTGWVESLRAVKSSGEVDAIRRAGRVADDAFEEIVAWLRPGVTERETAARLDLILAERGAEGRPFETIAAFGERSALPHARAGARVLREGDLALLDFGAVVDGYCSDMTRTVALGEPDDELREAHALVSRAQRLAVERLAPGMTGQEADAVAREVIDAAGFGERFSHSLGHGLGLEVHEAPRLSRKGTDVLEAGMVVTVEPGVYLPEKGGVRIEDDVVITPEGSERLTSAPRDMMIL